MKKLLPLLFIGLLFSSCDSTSPEEKIDNLNGYWEIKSAEMPDGSSKDFPFSEMVDYIVVENNEGFRKKMRPEFDGSFTTSEDQELLSVKVEDDSINLYHKTPFTSWKETLISSKEEEITLKNQHGIIYTYKRFTPYSLDDEEEK